jgi:hypothetical protein
MRWLSAAAVMDIDLDRFLDQAQFDVVLARVGGSGAGPMVGSLGSVCAAAVGVRSSPARRSSCAGVGRGAVSTIW